MVVFDHIAYVY